MNTLNPAQFGQDVIEALDGRPAEMVIEIAGAPHRGKPHHYRFATGHYAAKVGTSPATVEVKADFEFSAAAYVRRIGIWSSQGVVWSAGFAGHPIPAPPYKFSDWWHRRRPTHKATFTIWRSFGPAAQ